MMRNFGLIAVAFLSLVAVPALSGDDIASKIVNDPTEGWDGFGSGVKTELYDDAGVQGGKAIRLTVTGKSTNPWDAGAHINITKPIKQGDVLLLAFWARSETPPQGAATIDFTAEMQNTKAPYNWLGHADLHVGAKWKMYFVVGTADKDYDGKVLIAQLNLGTTGPLVLDLGPLFILNYGKSYDVSKLPHS